MYVVPPRREPVELRVVAGRNHETNKVTDLTHCSRKDQVAAQPQPRRRQEAAVAAVWEAVVCRVHHLDHWQLGQGGYSYVDQIVGVCGGLD